MYNIKTDFFCRILIPNINELFQFSDAAIISTSLKEGESKSPEEERNLKGYDAKIDSARVREFMGVVNDD